MIRWVRQEDSHGCVVACLAMVTGRTYQAVKSWFVGIDFASQGMTHMDAETYLGDHGIPFARRYRWLPGRVDGNQRQRQDFGVAFAPVHLVGLRDGRHCCVLLGDGRTVLDPMHPDPRMLDVELSYMVGIWPDVRLSMNAGTDGKDLGADVPEESPR